MDVNSKMISNLQVFFSRLNTNDDEKIDNNDDIDARIKEALNLNENSKGILVCNINEENFDYYNELYEKVTGKLQDLKQSGVSPKMGIDDIDTIEKTNPNIEIEFHDVDGNKKVPVEELIKEFIQLSDEYCKQQKSAEEIGEYFYQKYGFAPTFDTSGGVPSLTLQVIDENGNVTEKGYSLDIDKIGVMNRTNNVIFRTQQNDTTDMEVFYTKEGQFIKMK